jgi:hypothetical protein
MWAIFFTVKFNDEVWQQNGLGYILGDLFQTHPVTLVRTKLNSPILHFGEFLKKLSKVWINEWEGRWLGIKGTKVSLNSFFSYIASAYLPTLF